MNRIFIALVAALLLAPEACAQQRRLDSLLHVLKGQPQENTLRMRTLTALAKTYATIRPEKGLPMSHEAWRIADKLNDAPGRVQAWVVEGWNYYYLAEPTRQDSVQRLAGISAERSQDPRSLALTRAYVPYENNRSVEQIREQWALAVAVFKQLGDTLSWAELLYWRGFNKRLNTTADSIDHALALFKLIGDKSGQGMCLNSRMGYEPYLSDPGGRFEDLLTALDLFERDGNVVWSMWTRSNLGWNYQETADYSAALQHLLEALRLAEAFGVQDNISEFNNNIGDIYLALNDAKRALAHFRIGLADAQFLERRQAALVGLGSSFISLQLPDSALKYLELSANLTPRSGSEDIFTVATDGLLGAVHAMRGDTLKGVGLLKAALIANRKHKHNYAQVMTFSLLLGELLLSASDSLLARLHLDRARSRMEAAQLFQRALALGKQLAMLNQQQKALLYLSQLAEIDGDVRAALNFHQQYAVMKDSVLNADKTKAVADLQIQYETEKKEQQIVLLGKDKEVQAKEIQRQKLVRNGFVGGFVLVALFAGVFLFQRNRISKEKARSEGLLLNILPAEVAEELKAKGEADAKQIDQVTVLFTDFKGFTAMSEKLTAKELVADIHECFSAFDRIMEKHGIEKIKTIGDAYMAAGGLPTPNTTHAVDVLKAALEIRDFIAEGKARKVAAGLPFFEIRIGIHTGPVIAGIVGVKKFAYDIWGDTVNIASRMESSGEVGQVNISAATYALVKDVVEDSVASTLRVDPDHAGHGTSDHPRPAFTFTSRGKIRAKGKGEMEMYFVENK